MGPWSHGDWARNSAATIGNIFGTVFLGFTKKNIEANFFPPFL
jgi:hypothetical protein